MALPFAKLWGVRRRQRTEIAVIDLGLRITKLAVFRREGESVHLSVFALFEAPAVEKRGEPQVLAEHFKQVAQALGDRAKDVVLVIGSEDAHLYHGLMAENEMSTLRKVAKLNGQKLFQADLSQSMVDCLLLPPVPEAKVVESQAEQPEGLFEEAEAFEKGLARAGPGKTQKRIHVAVAAARAKVVEDLRNGATSAGLTVVGVTIAQVCPAAAFVSVTSAFHKEAVALVDIGFKSSTITILLNGALVLSRVVYIGADKLTTGLAESLNITYSVAEGIKQVMPEKVQAKLQSLISPLSQELRASVDFFEHKYEKSISEVLVCGGSARSGLLVHLLEAETLIPCRVWNPAGFLTGDLSRDQEGELKKGASQMVVAVGAGMACLLDDVPGINLLSEEVEAMELRRRDPLRRGAYISGAIGVCMLLWVGVLGFRFWSADGKLQALRGELVVLEAGAKEANSYSRRAGEIERTVQELEEIVTNRFLVGPVLNAMQFCVADHVEVVQLTVDRSLEIIPGTKAITNAYGNVTPGKPDTGKERVVLGVQAKDLGNPPAADEFIERLSTNEFFASHLRMRDSVRLIDRFARQIDPIDPERSFILFSIEAYFRDREKRDH